MTFQQIEIALVATRISILKFELSYTILSEKENVSRLLKIFFYIKNTLHTKYMVFQLLWCSGNAASVFLLTRKALSSFFNHLLAALCLFDMIYLITMLLEALRNLGLGTTTHTITIPSFLYPLNAIMMMASIYMTLVIGLERLGHSTIPR